MKIVPRQDVVGVTGALERPLNLGADQIATPAKDEKVAEDFEALFFDMMLQSMRKTAVSEDQSNAMSIYTGMLDSEYSKAIATSRSFGIKNLILDWLRRNERSTEQVGQLSNLNRSQVRSSSPPGARSNSATDAATDVDLITTGKLGNRLAIELYSLQARMLNK